MCAVSPFCIILSFLFCLHQLCPAHQIAIMRPVAQPVLPPVRTHSFQAPAPWLAWRPASATLGLSGTVKPVSTWPSVAAFIKATVTTATRLSGLMRDALSSVFVTPPPTRRNAIWSHVAPMNTAALKMESEAV